jgi:hypothetical protein
VQFDTGGEIEVRGSLDAALRSRPPALAYPSTAALESLPGDVADLGRATGADRVLAILDTASGIVLRAFDVPESGPAHQLRETAIEHPNDEALIRESVAELAGPMGGGPSVTLQRGSGGPHPAGPILMAVGGAALIAGAITSGLALAADGDLNAMCVDGRCPPSARGQADSLQTLTIVTDALLVGGGVVAASGLILLLVLEDGVSGTEAPVVAGCGRDGCSMTVRRTF